MTYKILNNFPAASFDVLARQNYLEFCQTSHIPRKDHHNRFFFVSSDSDSWLYRGSDYFVYTGVRKIVNIIFRSLQIVVTDNKNAFSALEADLKKAEQSRDHLSEKVSNLTNEKSTAETEVKNLRQNVEDLEKSKMVLQIKLETSISTSEELEKENEKLTEKVENLSSNISNAETRSEKATSEVAEATKLKDEAEREKDEAVQDRVCHMTKNDVIKKK